MSEKLPVDYRDSGHFGRVRKTRPSESTSPEQDLSQPDSDANNPKGLGGLQNAEDKINPERPSGAATTPVAPPKKKTIVWRARGHE